MCFHLTVPEGIRVVVLGGNLTEGKAQVVDISGTNDPSGKVCQDLPDISPLVNYPYLKGGFIHGKIVVCDNSPCYQYDPHNRTWTELPVGGTCK